MLPLYLDLVYRGVSLQIISFKSFERRIFGAKVAHIIVRSTLK